MEDISFVVPLSAVPPGSPPAPARRLSPRVRNALIALAVLLVIAGVAWHFCFFRGCPDVHRLASNVPGGAPVLLDRNGKEYADLAPPEAELVALDSLPKHVPDAFLAVEDKRFRDHGAVDVRRIFGALWANVRSRGMEEGSSTITMQLARNVFPDQLPGQKRTLGRKLLEVRVAQQIEGEFTKDQILEMYLNHIYFGSGAKGIEAAARQYFRRPAKDLSLEQAALLAAMPKAPTHYDPRRHPKAALERRNLVLTLMQEQKRIDAAAAEAANKRPLGVVSRPRAQKSGAPFAAYFVEEVRRELEERFGQDLYGERLRIHTTLDAKVQRAAEEELLRQLTAIEGGAAGAFRAPRYAASEVPDGEDTPYLQGAVVALEASTGDILAWVGGRDYRHSRFDRARQSRRQAGSAFKPFVYAAALQSGRSLAQTISDEPLRVSLDSRRTWSPQNFDGSFETRVTLRDALVRSKNVATVRLAQEVGIPRVIQVAEDAGLAPPIPDQPSMALGTVSVSPVELATAFTTFANLGERATPRMVLKVERPDGEVLWEADAPERKAALDPGIAYVVTDALREALVRGTGSSVTQAGFRGVAAGKTGTTNDGSDAWFVGYTPEIVAAVWVGFDQRRPIAAKATGGRIAAPVWARMMMRVYEGRRAPAVWPRPADVVEGMVDPSSGMLLAPGCRPWTSVAYREVFVRGSAPQAICPSQGEPQAIDMMAELGTLPDFEEGMQTGILPEDLPGEMEEGADVAREAPAGSAPPPTAPGAEPMRSYAPSPPPSASPVSPEAPPSPGASRVPNTYPMTREDPEAMRRSPATPRPSPTPAESDDAAEEAKEESQSTPQPTPMPPPPRF